MQALLLVAALAINYPVVAGDRLILPLEKITEINAGFYQTRGWRRNKRIIHGAIDQNAPIGTPVRAVADGKVVGVYSMSSFMKETNRTLRRIHRKRAKTWQRAKKRMRRCHCTRRIRRNARSPWRSGIYLSVEHKTDTGTVFKSQYMHLSKIFVGLNTSVKQGQIIALTGDTAIIDNPPHLHFQIRHRGIKKNPTKYIRGFTYSK
jgi:murein DD-endopeptidase MepM/ murein hydrolase activator NlpD